MPNAAIKLLALLALLAPPLPFILAISPEARRIQTTFTFVLSSQPLSNITSAFCPASINHRSIRTYRGIDPANSSAVLDGILWRDLSVNGIDCLSSVLPQAATRFTPLPSPPPDESADIANPWFITGTDNSPRRCGPFAPTYPALYFFTDNLPRFKQRFIDLGIIPRDIDLPEEVENPSRGDIYMVSQPYDPSSGGIVALDVICMYATGDVTMAAPSPRTSPQTDEDETNGGSVCFPASSTVQDENARVVTMSELRVGQRVVVGWHRGKEVYSAVISFSHHDAQTRARFTRIWVSRGLCGQGIMGMTNVTELTASRGHFIRMANGELRAMGTLKVGELVKVTACRGWEGGTVGRVEGVESVWEKGLYSPVTTHGDIVVGGVVASCYTTSVRVGAAHGLLTPVRWGFRLLTGVGVRGVEWCSVIDVLRWVFR